MMLAASAVLFGSFLLSSLYLQNVLGTGALETGLAFLPLAVAIGAGVHVGSHVITHAGVRVPLAAGFAVAAAGMLLLSGVDAQRQLPRRRPARHARRRPRPRHRPRRRLGRPCSPAPRDDETGMLSGLNTTGHEIGGSLGIAVLATIATGAARRRRPPPACADGIGDAFLAAAHHRRRRERRRARHPALRADASCPSCALAPRVAVH